METSTITNDEINKLKRGKIVNSFSLYHEMNLIWTKKEKSKEDKIAQHEVTMFTIELFSLRVYIFADNFREKGKHWQIR